MHFGVYKKKTSLRTITVHSEYYKHKLLLWKSNPPTPEMHKATYVCVLAGLVLVATAMPASQIWEPLQDGFQNVNPEAFENLIQQNNEGVRMARATCDLGSIATQWVTLNHSACAAHCLVLGRGFKGGRCRDGICHCRR